MMKKCGITNFVVTTLDGAKLFAHKGTAPASCVSEWNSILKYLTAHKELIVHAGNSETGKGSGVAKYQWEIFMEKDGKEVSQVSGAQAPGSGMSMGEIQGYIDRKVEGLEKDYKIKALEAELARVKDNPDESEGKMWAGIIKEGLFGNKENGSTLHGPDKIAVDDPDVATQLETLMGSILKKVSANKVIRLMKAIDKNPSLVDKALNFLG